MNPSVRILIVDDDIAFLETYRDILGREGHLVQTALDRESAISLLDRGDWDVILLDQKLRGSDGPDDGLDLLAEVPLRSPGAKVIMATAFATPETISRAFSAGVYDYLEKDGRSFSSLVRAKIGNAVEVTRERRIGGLDGGQLEEEIARTWQAAFAEVDANRKGKLLEELLLLLFKTISGLHQVEARVHNNIEEIDLVVRNESKEPFWANEGSYFLVECKNWSKPSGRAEIDSFYRKLERRFQRCRLGFFIAPGGFSAPAEAVRLADSKDSILLILIDRPDLDALVKARDRNAVLKALHQKAVLATQGAPEPSRGD